MTAYTAAKAKLLARLKELDGRLHDIEAELETPHSKDWDEMAVEREGDEVLEGLGEAGLQEIARIKAALQRLREGTYGDCVRCGGEISAQRLEVLPDTPFCKTCAA
ncbi:MAG: TraR/DksA family transcriptional regulator [Paracoccaceae bacterium]